MKSTMDYKKYVAAIEYDNKAETFSGRVINILDVIYFEGESVAELKQSFKEAVDGYLAMCADDGESPEKPFSGNMILRLGPDLHRRCSLAAKRCGQSLNSWIIEAATEKLPYDQHPAHSTQFTLGPSKIITEEKRVTIFAGGVQDNESEFEIASSIKNGHGRY